MNNSRNIYRLCRDELGISRATASKLMQNYVNVARLERIERGATPHPDEVLNLAKCYGRPDLCNYYCVNECAIGQQFVPEVKAKDLANIILEMLSTLNKLEQEKNRLIEITADGEISEDEYKDFLLIHEQLSNISMAVDSLDLWQRKTGLEEKLKEL